MDIATKGCAGAQQIETLLIHNIALHAPAILQKREKTLGKMVASVVDRQTQPSRGRLGLIYKKIHITISIFYDNDELHSHLKYRFCDAHTKLGTAKTKTLLLFQVILTERNSSIS